MAWPKGQPRGPKKKPEGNEPIPESEPVVIRGREDSPEPGQVFMFDTTIYHNEHEPQNLKAGSPLPEGWTTEPWTLTVKWQNKMDGSWFKVEE